MNSLPLQGKDASHTEILLYLISDLLAPDLWHLHTSDQNTHSRTGEIKQAAQMARGTAQRGESLRGWRAMKEDRMLGHGRNSERGCCSYPRRSLKSMQPKENQSALLSYAVPFWRTSGAM